MAKSGTGESKGRGEKSRQKGNMEADSKPSRPLVGKCQLPWAEEAEKAKHPGGRPTDYNPATVETILALIMEGKSLVEICRTEGMPHYSTVCRWLARHNEFSENYARAREVQMDYMAEEIKCIADEPPVEPHEVGWQKNRIEARKWLASKIFPKKYGDRITQEVVGKDGGPVEFNDIQRSARIAALLAEARKRAGK